MAKLLHHTFIENAKKYGNKVAIVDRTTNRRLTYDRTLTASLLLAKYFTRFEEGFLGVMVPPSAGCILSILGALMSKHTPVMINYSTGAERNCRFAQEKCDFETIVTSRALLEKINCPALPGMVFLEDILAEVSLLDKVRAKLLSMRSAEKVIASVSGGSDEEDVLILFTSGSERDPKAVELTHKNIRSNIESLAPLYDLSEKDIFLANLPYFHVFGQTATLWAPLSLGMTLVTYANPLDFKNICRIVREEKCTLVTGTPSFFWGYLEKAEPGDFDSARIMLVGADKCPEALRTGYHAKHQKVLLEAYGTTETSPAISVNTHRNNRPGSVGRPIAGVKVRLEHYDTGAPCNVGEIGKILVQGDNVMKGYFDDFEATSLAFRHGWYDTGDMGWMDSDGYLWHVGRLRRFMKVGGEMVSLIKVEDVLERVLPDGVKCCVVEVPDRLRGGKIVAAVTQRIDERRTLKSLAEHLPNIALPKQFVILDEFPMMASGKIDFRKVTEIVRGMLHEHGMAT